MTEAGPANDSERKRLEQRMRRLAEEKANLELVNQLMVRLSALPGLDNMVHSMLQALLDTIGGTNLYLYYWIDDQIHCADVYGERRVLDDIDDPRILQAMESQQPEEYVHGVEDSQLLNVALANSWTWVLPLLVGQDLVGVLRIDNLNVGTRDLRRHLQTFLTYAAAVLKNEILGYTRLLRINQELRVANGCLAEARDAAEAASRAKTTFLANMSHELRTPLNSVLGFAQLLGRDATLPETHRQYLGAIEHSGQHLLELINDILELSRIEAGRLTLRTTAFNLRELPVSLVEMLQVRAQNKQLELRLDCPESLPGQVEGDVYHLRQVLINLLGNAIKYTDQGTVTLRVQWHDRRAYFEVADTGAGVAEEDLERLFDPFFQAGSAVNRPDSTGLGLTISRDYVRLMGGDIGVESLVGMGSRFFFTIPLQRLAEPEAPPQAAPDIVGLAPDQPEWRILIADDDGDNRRLLSDLLAGVGFEVQQADNGARAVELFQYWRPHLIWMDIHMPVLDGFEATRQIRSLPGGSPVQIVILSATGFDSDREAATRAGADGFLGKPVRVGEIFETLRQRLGVRYIVAATPPPPHPARPARELEATAFRQIPPELLTQLKEASATLDAERARAAVRAIAASQPELAQALSRCVEDYRFDELLRLLEDRGEGDR